ncbi:MAG TPA: hypothetical protein VND90_05400 [Terracidiphilus sp.]|nr:hypothetical protein [Terracidiphilus sp.]
MARSIARTGAPSALASLVLLGSLAGCGGGSSSTPPPPTMTLTLPVSTLHLQQDGLINPTLVLTLTNAPGAVSVSVTGLPAGITAQYDATSASLSFSGGSGAPRSVLVETSGLGNFTSATLLTIDATTNTTTGPTPTSVDTSGRNEITLNGYGVAFLILHP